MQIYLYMSMQSDQENGNASSEYQTDKILSRDRNGNKTGVCSVKKNGRDD